MTKPKILDAIITAICLATLRETLAMLTAESADSREVGRRTLLLAYATDATLIGSQRDLAKRLGVTEGRASQMLKAFRKSLHR